MQIVFFTFLHPFSTFSSNKKFLSVVIDCALIYGKLMSMLKPYNRTISHKSMCRVLVVLSFQSSSVNDNCVL